MLKHDGSRKNVNDTSDMPKQQLLSPHPPLPAGTRSATVVRAGGYKHTTHGLRSVRKEYRVIPSIRPQSSEPVETSDSVPVPTTLLDSHENAEARQKADVSGGTVAELQAAERKIQYLEKSMEFLKAQHQELVTCLHEEVDRLKRKNKELQFCMVMVQERVTLPTSSGTGEQRSGPEQPSTIELKQATATKPFESSKDDVSRHQHPHQHQQGLSQLDSFVPPSNSGTSRIGGDHGPVGTVATDTLNTVGQSDGSHKESTTWPKNSRNPVSERLDELRTLFHEEEMKEMKKALEAERAQNRQLMDLIRQSRQIGGGPGTNDKTYGTGAKLPNNRRTISDVAAELVMHGGYADDPSIRGGGGGGMINPTALPYGASLEPLLVHVPPQLPRAPTLRECQSIVRHLQQCIDHQAHELNQLKSDLHDVLYSHKWTPDAYLLARAYVADDDAAAESEYRGNSPVRIAMKHATRKIPDAAYLNMDSMNLPAISHMVSNKSIERQKRVQSMHRTRTAAATADRHFSPT